MTDYILPDAKSVQKMLAVMYGDELAVDQDDSVALADRHVATYVGDDNGIVAICACEDRFVAYSGAALTMVPAAVADDMVKQKDLSAVILENFHEVMNICSRLLISDTSPHLRLDRTLMPGEADPAMSKVTEQSKVVNFKVAIPEYGPGHLSFLII
jgi:hypothetical protein